MPKRKVVIDDPPIIDLLKPREVDAMLALGQQIVDGKTLKQADFNKGRMSAKAIRDEIDAYNAVIESNDELIEAGKDPKPLPATAPLYHPVLVEAGKMYGGQFGYAGQASKQLTVPPNWPTAHLGEWRPPVGKKGDDDYEPRSVGWKLGEGRKCHESDQRRNVIDREENILTVGASEYVVGTKDVSAIYLHNASKTGSYGAVTACGKRLSFGGNNAIVNLVGQFNNKVEAVTVDDGTVGARVVILPNMLVRWGYIERINKRMTVLQIRKAVESDDTKGMKFVALDAPIVGNGFSKSNLWQAVKKAMSLKGTIRDEEDGRTALERFEAREARSDEASETIDKVWTNFGVICRTSFTGVFPFGVRAGLGQCPPVTYYGDSVKEELGRFVIGCLTGHDYKETRWAAKDRLSEDEVEAPAPKAKAAPAKASKPKAPKAKAKTAKAQATTATTAKPVQVDAPPVQVIPAQTEPVVENETADDPSADIETETVAQSDSDEG